MRVLCSAYGKGCTSHPGHIAAFAPGMWRARRLLVPRALWCEKLRANIHRAPRAVGREHIADKPRSVRRSEEHTSELQSQSNLVCRLLLEKKKPNSYTRFH